MRVGVSSRLMIPDRMEGIAIVNYHIIKRMAAWHPDDIYDCYYDRSPDKSLFSSPNIYFHHFPPPTRLPFLVRGWLNFPVKMHMNLKGSDVFYSPDGFIPLGMKIPKVGVIHDIAFLRYPEFLPKRNRDFYEKWMPRYVEEMDHIITVSEYSKKEIIEVYKTDPKKVTVVYNGGPEGYFPLSDVEKASASKRFANSKPYFVNVGAIHPRKNSITLLNAFQLFKENTNSEVQLVIAGRPSWNTEEFYKALDQHPFRKDIHMPGYVKMEDMNFLVGGALAMIYPSWYEGFGLPILEAMAANVPVISSNSSSLPEVAGNATILASPYNPEDFAIGMAAIYADHAKAEKLIEAGRLQLSKFSWDEAARMTHSILERAANRK